MKRFGFFLAVFSVGLLVLLLSTGQLDKLFRAGDSTVELPRMAPPARSGAQRDRMEFRSLDLARGRERFTISGTTDEAAYLDPQNLQNARNFYDAVIEVPEYGAGDARAAQAPPVLYRLEARHAFLDVAKATLRMSESIIAKENDETRFQSTEMNLEWDDEAGRISVSGSKPVVFSYPGRRLHGEGGFAAELAGESRLKNVGMKSITVRPPVVVALARAEAGGLLGLNEAGTPGSEPESAAAKHDVIVLHSEKDPLRIDRRSGDATFVGTVAVYRAQVGPDAPLFPPPAPGDASLICRQLTLTIDPATRRFQHAVAHRTENELITAHLGGRYQLWGEHLEWTEERGELLLSGQVRAQGPLGDASGEFTAEQARLFPLEQRCVLAGHVASVIHFRYGSEEPARTGTLEADELEIAFSTGSRRGDENPATPVRRLEAASEEANGVILTLDRPPARLLGSRLIYDQSDDLLRLLPKPEPGAARPCLEEGQNTITAGEVQMGLGSQELCFLERVECRIASVSPELRGTGRKGGSAFEQWLPSGNPEELLDLACDELRLRWNAKEGVREIVAKQGVQSPVALVRRTGPGGERVEVSGEVIQWQDARRVMLSGAPGRQRLRVRGTELSAGEIEFDTVTFVGRASTEVRVESLLADGAEGREPKIVTVESDQLEVELTQASIQGERDAERKESGGKEPSAPLHAAKRIRAWSEEGRPVRATSEGFAVEGAEFIWAAEDRLMRVEGEGRQRIRHLGETGTDEATAERLVISLDERRLDMSGDVRATIHLDVAMVEQTRQRAPGAAARPTPWLLTADAVRITFPPPPKGERRGAGAAKDAGPLLPEEILAGERITLDNAGLEVHFEGSNCHWSRKEQRLRLYSMDGKGRQIFQHHEAPTDEIIAREVSVLRLPGEPVRLNVLFIDVADAVLHGARERDGGKKRDDRLPGVGRLRAQNLLLEIAEKRPASGEKQQPEGAEERTDERGMAGHLVEALAWGKVLFEGGEYQVFAERARYEAAEELYSFYGGGEKQPVRMTAAGQSMNAGDTVFLRITESGYVLETKGRYAWDPDLVQSLIEAHGQKDRAP